VQLPRPHKALGAALVAAALALPAGASADWSYTKADATRLARAYLVERYPAQGMADAAIGCYLPTLHRAQHSHAYHRWYCPWSDDAPTGRICTGTVVIAGRPGADRRAAAVVRRMRCEAG
jgi:hypothetical protein